MSIVLIALTTHSGLPIFSRSFNNSKKSNKIAFVNVATLNGINLFCNANHCVLYYASTAKHIFYWKNFESLTILLIFDQSENKNISSDEGLVPENNLENFLNIMYNLIIMFTGEINQLDENLESIKIKIKKFNFVIDFLLEKLYNKSSFSLQINFTEFKLVNQKYISLCNKLINFSSKKASSDYLCFLIDYKIVSASKSYCKNILPSMDGLLISFVVQSFLSQSPLNKHLLNEFDIYLPENCKNVLTRLIFTNITDKCTLLLLCGSYPDLTTIQDIIINPIQTNQKAVISLNELENQSFIQSELILDDKLINLIFMKTDQKVYFKYGIFDNEKISMIISVLRIFDYNKIIEQVITSLKYKIFFSHDLEESYVFVAMFTQNIHLKEMRELSAKMILEINKYRKKKFFFSNKYFE